MSEKKEYVSQLKLLVQELSEQIDTGIAPEVLSRALQNLVEQSFTLGQKYEYSNLMTTSEAAAYLGVSDRSLRVVISARCRKFGIGRQLPGKDPWLFRKDEVEALRPDQPGRPKRVW